MSTRFLASVVLLAFTSAASAQVKIIQDFEQPSDLKTWEFKKDSASLSDQHVTHGRKSLRIAVGEYMASYTLPGDWSGFDSLEMDVFVEADGPVAGSLLIADQAWKQKGSSYWNRHNSSFSLRPGANVLSIPVHGLYRGEAGSRNNDIKSNIDPAQIIRVDLGFNADKDAPAGRIYIDNMRLVKESRPDGILAFDLGPEGQTLFPGFTAISPATVYGKGGAKAGLKFAQPAGFARDDTFPTRLYRDYIGMDGNEFIADLPNGSYRVWVVFDDLGYWGGEECCHRKRSITAQGKVAWSEDRGEDGPADYLYHFEKIEPTPTDKLWDLYMAYLFEPKRFAVQVTDGKLSLRFAADAPHSTKVAAIIIYPDTPGAALWVKQVEERNRKEFEDRAVCMGPKAKALQSPVEAQAKGWWLGFPGLEEDVSFYDPPGDEKGKLARISARGQRVSMTFAVRTLKDWPEAVKLTALPLKSTTRASIDSSHIDLRYVHHSTHRGFNDIAYTIGPEGLRLVEGADLRLKKDLTRQFWVTVDVPRDTKPGSYSGKVVLQAGALSITLPIAIEVIDVALDEPDFVMGFFGMHVPPEVLARRGAEAWRELFKVVREAGMNSFTGGPDIPFTGLDAAGHPKLDFAACDEFFRIARECGFDKPVCSYGGPAMVTGLHDTYVIGQTGRDWERKTGKTMGELLKVVWGAVEEHAKKENWPPVMYEMTDEQRVAEQVQNQLELMKLYREAVPPVKIGGSYSVRWGDDRLEKGIQEIFHTLCWSSVNTHSQTDLDKAREWGKELHIYNQGTTRYSFGAYQWAEMHKGVRGRMQWHLLALHGYQFFDLDGREPDTAMINWGRERVIPTLHLARCREGADDFRFAVTLWNLAHKNPKRPENAEAIAWLEDVSAKIAVSQRTRPAGFMEDEAFRMGCAERIGKIMGKP